jgi:hypothetical protein
MPRMSEAAVVVPRMTTTSRSLILAGLVLLVVGLGLVIIPPTVQVAGSTTRCPPAIVQMAPSDPGDQPPSATDAACTDAMFARSGPAFVLWFGGAGLIAAGAIIRQRQRKRWWQSVKPADA